MNRQSPLFLLLIMLVIQCSKDESPPLPQTYKIALKSTVAPYPSHQMAFLHLSDPHGSCISLIPALYYLENSACDFGLLTGDIMATPTMIDQLRQSAKRMLLIPGNHDAYTVYYGAVGQHAFRNEILNTIQQTEYVTFGSPLANYWFRDFQRGGYTLRVIGIDQYEVESVGHPANTWDMQCLYTQQQADWLVNLLEHSEHVDGIIIAIHNGFGNSQVNPRDTTNPTNNFTSILARYYNNGYDYYGTGNLRMIPDILNAYQTGINLDRQRYPNSHIVDDTLVITTHFQHPHDNFICYLGGHLHWDVAETLPDYPHQLQILVADGGETVPQENFGDIVKGDQGNASYCFNLNIIDFKRRQLTIKRIGANRIINGSTRDSIQFSFR